MTQSTATGMPIRSAKLRQGEATTALLELNFPEELSFFAEGPV
jgi:hypothetical protein